ncbi:MAG: efflux RND transporter periplasmic adaptor subunit [Saprospiraceae bacterium]|nr:efflux RND transporter periplasmic adaptor subunit [Saprospiraceae bacterium]
MKNIIKMSFIKSFTFYLLHFTFFGLILVACNKKAEPVSETAESNIGLVQLSDEQMELAGIELGKPEKRVIAGYVECTGLIEVPPYSLYSVFTPTAGFIQSAKWLPGDFVKKGALLTSIKYPDIVKLQREFLEVQSQLEFLQNDLKRKETLAAADAASQKTLEQAKQI